ncbi:MAG: peptide deformylase [Bdellovibrionales bacterium]|nr:peptide deformylase [Bdellovibrionales bacterium]
MAIRKVARLGNPVLRKKTRTLSPDEIRSPEIQHLIQDLRDTQAEYGGIGIAAPQIEVPLRVAILEFSESSARYPGMGAHPLTVFINAKVTVLDSHEQSFWEGCLSVPGLRGKVSRPRKIRVDYLDENAEPCSITAEGFLATVFQHELDHLDGVLFIDRIKTAPGATELAFTEEYQRFHAGSSSLDES